MATRRTSPGAQRALGRAIRCADLSRFYANGWGTAVSKEREAEARKRACELGDKPSCVPVPKAKREK